MFHRVHVRTRRCIANSPDIRSHHYCSGGYHLGCMPWYCDPWTFADTAGLVPWIGHHGLLIGGRLETRYRGVPIILHRTIDWRLAALSRSWVSWNGTSWLLPFGELFVTMNFVVWTFGGFKAMDAPSRLEYLPWNGTLWIFFVCG